jgi:hypothetical protein
MNPAVAAVYARSIGTDHSDQKVRDSLIDCIMPLVAEVNRMESLLEDPFIRGYLAARKQWVTGSTVTGAP